MALVAAFCGDDMAEAMPLSVILDQIESMPDDLTVYVAEANQLTPITKAVAVAELTGRTAGLARSRNCPCAGGRSACPRHRYRLKTALMLSPTMRAPTAVAAPPMTPLVIVSLCSVPNFLAVAMTGSAAEWKPSSKAPPPLTAS